MSAARRCAVVTGGARGIGEAITRNLLARGTDVVVADLDEAAIADFRPPADAAGRVTLVTADVAEEGDWHRVLDVARSAYGPVTVLVNNAAISPKRDGQRTPSSEMPLDEWNRVLAVNLTGAFLGAKLVHPGMKAAGWGRIVNISSQAARTGARVAGVHYGATKAALLGLTRTLAFEYGPDGITVNAVTPGRIMTPMAAAVADEVNQAMRAGIPVGRLGTPEDTAAVVGFLASDEAGFVNGATVDANGGSWMG
ncbi:SDR family NAD(P)-dependent oxidoreductase [Blastococcus sp. TF02A-30]|uniref:SDR family NAD(P)-dependent oxidoreductase n=1 Tax=Blastococcus sp. TF02A-30 TaxID=2250580 RepID=UPI000DE86543|nr:SDR family NAD(P)-dependent oxidoreductase [Blastococcus sp. TF02A-30]RBY84130.1 SDR family NAD(P)-dependent oxidoreductase [Blastococcus sp. TF02A-30]